MIWFGVSGPRKFTTSLVDWCTYFYKKTKQKKPKKQTNKIKNAINLCGKLSFIRVRSLYARESIFLKVKGA